MIEKRFKLTTLSDVVMIGSSNTEGKIEFLDYIPGSAIRGIAAKSWSRFDSPFEVFYTPSIRFCDAHPLIDGEASLKIPLSFHQPKNNDEENRYFNFHRLEKEDWERHRQFKQERGGYFVRNRYLKPTLNYRQKSARDYKKGRSKKGQMFAYASIPAGMAFVFTIKAADNELLEKVAHSITGKHKIGKSKSAEYATVKIEPFENGGDIERFEDLEKSYIYVKSRLFLHDERGNPTFDIARMLDKRGIAVDYEKSQIRTGRYSPYNRTRNMYDAQRPFVEKGSVIVTEKLCSEDIEKLEEGIGGFLNEGFGEVLVNPWFLKEKNHMLYEAKSPETQKSADRTDDTLLRYLTKEKRRVEEETKTVKTVQEFMKTIKKDGKTVFKSVTPSQWGTVRAFAKKYKEGAKKPIEEFISTGTKRWNDTDKEALMKFLNATGYKAWILLATEMAKKEKR